MYCIYCITACCFGVFVLFSLSYISPPIFACALMWLLSSLNYQSLFSSFSALESSSHRVPMDWWPTFGIRVEWQCFRTVSKLLFYRFLWWMFFVFVFVSTGDVFFHSRKNFLFFPLLPSIRFYYPTEEKAIFSMQELVWLSDFLGRTDLCFYLVFLDKRVLTSTVPFWLSTWNKSVWFFLKKRILNWTLRGF